MEFGLSSEQKLLSETVRRFVEQQVPLDRVRQIAAERSGFDQAIWQGLADLGVLGIIVPEEYGGAGLSFFDAALVQEHLDLPALIGILGSHFDLHPIPH